MRLREQNPITQHLVSWSTRGKYPGMTSWIQLKMSLLVTIVWMLTLFMSIHSLTFFGKTETGHSDVVYVELVHSEHTREKRSAEQLPDVLHFSFSLGGSSVDLKMKVSARDPAAMPVYVFDKGERNLLNLTIEESLGIYSDPSRGSALMIQRKGQDEFDMAGTFHHDTKAYKIWPEEHHGPKKRSILSRVIHRVRPLKAYDMTNDTVHVLPRSSSPRDKRSAMDTESASSLGDAPHAPERYRRQSSTDYIIEVGMFSDFADYQRLITLFQSADFIRYYYSYVIESMNVRFQTIGDKGSGYTVTVWGSYLELATQSSLSSYTESIQVNGQVNDNAALDLFTTHADAATDADVYLAFTGYDLVSSGNADVGGAAYLGSLCTSDSAGIIENTLDGFTGALAAHELGHVLGANHDSDVSCQDSDNYVMATILQYPSTTDTPSNLWTFSSCSIATFSNFLNGALCAKQLAGTQDLITTDYAGQTLGADKQCSMSTSDTTSVLCRHFYNGPTNFNDICEVMWCSATGTTSCSGQIAQRYTSCGSGKWCDKGSCVAHASAPVVPETCVHGDDPGFGCAVGNCNTYSSSELMKCCLTCSPPTSPITSATSATTSATSATTSATPVTTSATSATTSPTSATTSPTSATTSATSATTSPTSATTSATSATTSATSATTSATSATTSATPVTTSATPATSATSATTSATPATTSATSATTSVTSPTPSPTTVATSPTTAPTTSRTASATTSVPATPTIFTPVTSRVRFIRLTCNGGTVIG